MSLVASTLGVGRSTVYERLAGSTKTRGHYTKADDAHLLPLFGKSPRSGQHMATAASRRSSIASCAPKGWHRSITSASTASWR